MKKLKIHHILLMMGIMLISTSCSNKIFLTNTLDMNYVGKMTSKKDRSIKAKVKIFYNESDVKGEYEVLSLNKYSPWFQIPIFYSVDKQINNKFIVNAVKTTYDQGGNGIIVMAPGYYKAIHIKDFDSDNAEISQEINIIADMTLVERFRSGKMANAERSAQKRYKEALKNEIKANLRYAKTLEDIDLIKEKIKTYDEFNMSLESPDESVGADVISFNKELNSLEKKIRKKMAKTK